MKIGIAVFAYCRKNHLSRVLNALKENGVEKLYIFQDGLKNDAHKEGWSQTTELIESIDWCEVDYIKAETNQGLADSIVKGISYVLSRNDAVIIVEDDCLPMPSFLTYMRQCLEKYRDHKNVFHINGYGRPFYIEPDDSDMYFNYKMGCWGWGTWKDRWDKFDRHKDYLSMLRQDKNMSLKATLWSGMDIEDILISSVNGENDTWDVWWTLNVLENDGLCINPYRSLIQNIGFDESGTNCHEVTQKYNSVGNKEQIASFRFPKEEKVRDEVMYAFAESGWGSYTALKQIYQKGEFIQSSLISDAWRSEQKKALVYGLGYGFKINEKLINEMYEISGFIDKNRMGLYAGLPIMKPDEILQGAGSSEIRKEYDIVITLLDRNECQRVSNLLMERYKIDRERIVFINKIVK